MITCSVNHSVNYSINQRKYLMKTKLITVAGVLLTGCSSPPPPPPVNWSGSTIEINSTMPDWKENNVVIPSPVITGHWAKAIYDFDGEKGHYLPDDYFAV
ncbi:MAG: hypothetical protein EKE20_15865, partial [Candidatus Symbiopectobacterium sp. Dall1.0]|nr:hypothetical protein [Candidatus Symbiopectobacterium sp. Dall1.0]